jgi:catechol 2,3-dioxygenase-like lactoylglutathione lyase family enzyme
MTTSATGLNATSLGCSLTCKAIDTSIAFYRDVLGFTVDMTFAHEGRLAGAVISAGHIRIVLNQGGGRRRRCGADQGSRQPD